MRQEPWTPRERGNIFCRSHVLHEASKEDADVFMVTTEGDLD